jgi:RNA polymerase sigma-70 factor (ECF subfamily)
MPVSGDGGTPPGQSVRGAGLEALMTAYQQSDHEAAATLVARISPPIFQFFLAQSRNRAEAEDLLQDFWLRIHKARATFRPGEPLLPWLYAIARRVRVDHYRRTKRVRDHEVLSDQLPEKASVPDSARQTVPKMTELLKSLPESQRETLLLLKVSGMSLEEVARATGVSIGSVKQKAHRAYESLRKRLGEAK